MKKSDEIKILAVDDSHDILKLYQELLARSDSQSYRYQLKTATDAAEAMRVFDSFLPDVLILDVYLAGSTGLEICRNVRQKTRYSSYVGIIFVTGEHSPKLMAACLELGADDFCSKSQTPTELLARIKSVARIKRMADSLKAANEKLRSANERLTRISITDDLTGLYNMKYFKKRLYHEFIRADRYQKHLSIIMLDLDFFKQVNDRCDHLMGSFVLSETGKMLHDSVRNLDIAARFGGDEYVIMLPETDQAGAYIMAERIRSAIEARKYDNQAFQVRISASIGVSTMGPGTSSKFRDSNDLVRKADKYLYEAKEAGRNRVIDMDRSLSSEEELSNQKNHSGPKAS